MQSTKTQRTLFCNFILSLSFGAHNSTFDIWDKWVTCRNSWKKRSHTHNFVVVQNIINYTKLFFHSYNIDISIPSQKIHTIGSKSFWSRIHIHRYFTIYQIQNISYSCIAVLKCLFPHKFSLIFVKKRQGMCWFPLGT